MDAACGDYLIIYQKINFMQREVFTYFMLNLTIASSKQLSHYIFRGPLLLRDIYFIHLPKSAFVFQILVENNKLLCWISVKYNPMRADGYERKINYDWPYLISENLNIFCAYC